MPKLKTFPKTISVKIEPDKDGDYLVCDPDGFGLGHAVEGKTVNVGIYKLDHIREVVLTATSTPLKK